MDRIGLQAEKNISYPILPKMQIESNLTLKIKAALRDVPARNHAR